MLKYNHLRLAKPVRSHILLLLLCSFLSLTHTGFAQSSCTCPKIRDFDEVLEKDSSPDKYFWKLRKSSNKACKARGFIYSIEYALNLNQLDSVEFFLKKHIQLARELDCKMEFYHNYYFNAQYYYFIDDQAKMVESSYQALKVAEAMNDKNKMFTNMANLCLGYKNLEQPKLIKKYTSRMYQIARTNPDRSKKVRQLAVCSSEYLVLYQDFGVKAYLDTVKRLAVEAYDISVADKDTLSMIISCRKIESYYYYSENYPMAIETLKKAIELTKLVSSKNNYDQISMLYSDAADIYLKLKAYPLAKIYVDSAVNSAANHDNPNTDMMLSIYSIQVEVARATNDFKTAYEFTEKIREIEDSVLSVEKHKTIYEFEQKYQKAQDLKKISDLAKDKEIGDLRIRSLIGLIVGVLLALIIIVIAWRQNRIRNKLALVESEQRLNRARINPHFFFNALTSIQAMSEEGKNERVPSLISKFSKIMRASLESTYSDLVTLETEAEFITNYLSIQRTRYDQKFDFEVIISHDLDADVLKIPSMMLQPFLENSVEHGFKGLNKMGHIRIDFKEVNQELHITIEDNGIGFTGVKNHGTYPSRAKQIVTERLSLLNKKYHSKARFDWQTGINGGVCVEIVLPLLD